MNLNDIFNNRFAKYCEKTDKFDSLYIFVIYKTDLEDSCERVSRMIAVIDAMKDPKKKSYLKTRLHDFREYLRVNFKPSTNINSIFMVSDIVDEEPLDKYHVETLNMFDHQKCSYEFGSNFPLKWLKDLLLDREYVNSIYIKNNDIRISKLNSTKKITTFTDTVKSMNLNQIISDNISKGDIYVVHGVSAVLKGFVDTAAIACYTKEISDEDILQLVKNSKCRQNQKELTDVLSKQNDSKEGAKLVYGRDIQKCVKESMLKCLYCSDRIYERTKNIPPTLRNFEIKVIGVIEKGDIGDRLEKDYDGAIGVKYY
jgi:hypothetical protein